MTVLRRTLLILCLTLLTGCVELETRPASASLSLPITRANADTQISRDVVEVQATPVVIPSPADPTLDDDDDDEEEEDAEDAAHPRRSTAR